MFEDYKHKHNNMKEEADENLKFTECALLYDVPYYRSLKAIICNCLKPVTELFPLALMPKWR